MSMNFNDAEPQADFSPLPDGTMVWLGLDLHFGGFGDDRSLTNSKEGDSRHLNMELTVLYGRYAKRKLFERWTVEAQNPTEGLAKSIAISRSRLRALLNSARGIPPKDDSERAKMGRTLDGYGQLHKMCFAAEIGVRQSKDPAYPQPRNFIKKIIEPDHELYGAIRTGTYVQPDPAQQAPAWGGQPQQPAWGGGQPQQPQRWAAPPTQQQVTPYPDQQWSAPPPAPAQPQQQWAAPQQQQWNAPPPAAAQPQQQWNAPPPAPWGQDPNAGGGYVAPTAPTGPAPGGWNGAPQAPQGQPAAAGSDGTPDWATPADNDGKPAS